jgi:hypothetical protein
MAEWEDELERWLKPFLDRLGHKTRQRMCPLYVAGLIGPGDRKSVQPMAERLATGDPTRLVRQHRPYGSPFIVGEFIAHDSSPQFGSLNHGGPAKRKAYPGSALSGQSGPFDQPTTPPKLSKMTKADLDWKRGLPLSGSGAGADRSAAAALKK